MIFSFRYYITVISSFLLVITFNGFNIAQSISFKHLTVENGLSNNDVNTLIQDKAGFIWFGTEDGLNRFDGYKFKILRNNPSDSNSLSNNSVWALLEDSNGNIWVGTKDGKVNIFNPVYESFSQITPQPKLKDWNSITALFEDKSGNIWIGTRSTGVYKYNPESKHYTHWSYDTLSNNGLSHFSVRSIVQDQQGNIIVATFKGLNKIEPGSSQIEIKNFYHEQSNLNSLSSSQIYNLTKSNLDSEIIWIGTPTGLNEFNSAKDSFNRIKIPNKEKLQFGEGASTVIEEVINGEKIIWTDTYSGLLRINLTTGSYHRFTDDPDDPNSIIDNQINKIIKDRSGVIWIATENGVSFYSPKSTRFNSPFNENVQIFLNASKLKTNLRAMLQDRKKNVWLGFSDGLISINNSPQNKVINYNPQFDKLNVWSLSADSASSLWIGTYGQGLKKYDLNSGKQNDLELIYKKTNEKTVPFIKSLFNDSKNNVWIGYWGSGLGFYDPSNGTSKVWRSEADNPASLNFQDIWSITEDRFGRIWLATPGGGLNLVKDIDNNIFQNWIHSEDDTNSISSNSIFTVYVATNYASSNQSNQTILWIGTNNGLNRFSIINKGLNRYNFSVDIKYFTKNNGLPDNNINSILEDDNGNLWIGTGAGISFFDVENESFINFNRKDGINGITMNPDAALKLTNGLMIFGSTDGINIFNANEIIFSDYKPNVLITDFQLFNQSIGIGKKSILKKSINFTEEIILNHNDDVFSFEFAALDFNAPEQIHYAYKMEGFDDDWIYSENRRFVTYTNLNPGTYFFKVKSTNADGIWNNQEASVKIIINPPWWATLWAYGLYTVLIIIGLIVIRRFEINRVKLRNELRLRQVEAKKNAELEEMKSRFFANLSHEFRTPLMLIKGPLENLKKSSVHSDNFDDIELIDRNSKNLEKLIDELLELSQLESSSVPLKTKKENLVILLRGIVSSFSSVAEQKNIFLTIKTESDSVPAWIDRDKFEKIMNNLLSNAFKFTPAQGKIEVDVSILIQNEKQYGKLIVRDTGIGISSDKIDKIFDRFFQADQHSQRSYGGSGIGLALVKELIDLHKWEISVKSELEKGTEFIIKIPLWDEYLSEEEKVKYSTTDNSAMIFQEASENIAGIRENTANRTRKKAVDDNLKPVVLVVDDSDDVRKYLRNLLEKEYTIYEASNGFEGVRSAVELNPDLIISDVMMPSMDGIEFCNQIKSDWHTSDIPVILLTAKASFESKLEGLETGADDYLTKPFESRELFIRIINILEQRKRIREKYSREFPPLPETEKLESDDQDLIKRAHEIVQLNLDKTNFNTDHLAKELFLSRSQLHRKMISITGQAPGEFIRTIKLKSAADMLINKKLSVTQIAYAIGFSSPAQFSRAFSKQFNCTPSEYSSSKTSE